MAQKKHFNATTAPQKISRLIITISQKSRKNTWNALFLQKCPLVGHFSHFFLQKRRKRISTQKKTFFAVHLIPQNASFKL